MANVSHASLTGASLHEPKGIETAASGEAYLADGLGSGAWTSLGGLNITGWIFPWGGPIAPDGSYELDGSTISSSTDAPLYNAYTIQGTGTRVSGTAVISGLTSTTHFRVGYYIFGTGIPNGTTILTINGPTDITMSANAASSGSSTVIVSPWQLVSGGLVLPDMTTAGRYLRSRYSTNRIGLTQANQNKEHDHDFETSTNTQDNATITTGNQSHDHTHNFSDTTGNVSGGGSISTGGGLWDPTLTTTKATAGVNTNHTHNITMPDHTHTGTTDPDGGTEARPESLIVMWCVKR